MGDSQSNGNPCSKMIKGVLSGQGDNWFETFVNSHLFFLYPLNIGMFNHVVHSRLLEPNHESISTSKKNKGKSKKNLSI
jgi:hypothetical protein